MPNGEERAQYHCKKHELTHAVMRSSPSTSIVASKTDEVGSRLMKLVVDCREEAIDKKGVSTRDSSPCPYYVKLSAAVFFFNLLLHEDIK